MYSEWAHAHKKGRIKKFRQKENKSAGGQQIKTSLLETVVNRISKLSSRKKHPETAKQNTSSSCTFKHRLIKISQQIKVTE